MRVFSDEEYQTIDVGLEFNRIDEMINIGESTEVQISRLKAFQRTRHITCWHDGSTISNHGHLLVTVSILYDLAIFYTDEEYYQLTGTICIILFNPSCITSH